MSRIARRSRTMIASTALLAGLGTACANSSADTTPGPDIAAAPAVVAAPGRVEAATEEVTLAAEVAGRLAAVLVDENDVVAAGDVVARIASDDLEAQVAAATAALAAARAERDRVRNGARAEEEREARAAAAQAEAERDLARTEQARHERLYAQGVVALVDRERALRDLRVAEARLRERREQLALVEADARVEDAAQADANVALAAARLADARARLAKAVVVAPFDGVILERHRRSGESVAPGPDGGRIVTMADLRQLRVRLEVDERDIGELAEGLTAWATSDAYPGRRFEGAVRRIGRLVGPKTLLTGDPSEPTDTRVLEVIVDLAPDTGLPVGHRVDGFIALP